MRVNAPKFVTCPRGVNHRTFRRQDFYPNGSQQTGHLCRKCDDVHRRERRAANPQAARAIYRRYYARHRTKKLKYMHDYYLANKHKFTAHTLVFVALRKGTLKKSPCARCGSEKVEGHHPDYSHPLEVVWLCHFHHMELEHAQATLNVGIAA